MKVLHITYNLGLGGVEQMFLRYTEAFLSLGWDVTCMVPSGAKLLEDLKNHACSTIINNSVASSLSCFNPFTIWLLKRRIKKLKPDLVVVHNGRPLQLLQIVTKGFCPVVAVHHGGNCKRFKYVKHVICITHYMERELQEKFVNHLSLYYLPNVIENNFRALQHNKNESSLRVGFIGRLEKSKGAHDLLDAIGRLHPNRPIKLYIAGEGEQKQNLVTKAKESGFDVTFCGWVKEQSKQAFFNNIDVLVVPSYHEAFGIVIIEGWAAGVPVISTKTKGGIELIKDGVNGLLVEIGDVEAMARAIDVVSSTDTGKITHNAKQSLKEFSLESFRQKLKDVCERIADQKA